MDSFIYHFTEDLKNPDVSVREQATRKIWRIWFQQKGIYGLEKIDHSQKLLDAGGNCRSREITYRTDPTTTRLCRSLESACFSLLQRWQLQKISGRLSDGDPNKSSTFWGASWHGFVLCSTERIWCSHRSFSTRFKNSTLFPSKSKIDSRRTLRLS